MLELCTPVWSPHYKTDINAFENLQRAYTRKLFQICHLEPTNYDTRLAILGLQRIELRRIHFDLLFMYKLTQSWHCEVRYTDALNNFVQHLHSTRRHRCKLSINRARKLILNSFFSFRVAPIRNALPVAYFKCNSFSIFKRSLCKLNFNHYHKGRS